MNLKDLERTIENKGESLLQSDTRCDGKHSVTPNDPDCDDPQSIPIDNYAGSCPSKTWNQKTSSPAQENVLKPPISPQFY
jgi:hypothetical protein